IRVALTALLVNKGRSMLTSLGIVIGISAVIAMVSAGSGARYKLDDRLESVGKNLILIKAGSRTQQGIVADYNPLKSDDAAAIRKQMGPLLVGVAESQFTQRIVSTPNINHGTLIVGSVPDLKRIRNWKLAYGQFYSEEDVKRLAPVCLLGQSVRKKIFPDRPDPIGETVRVGHLQLRVIGVLEEKGRSPTGADQDDQIFIPITTLQRKLTGDDSIAIIVTATKSEEMIEKAKGELIRVMRDRHHIKPGGTEDFDVSTVREMAELAVILTTTMQILIAIIASISLVVGGIGIMNIMLVSVTERTREIGIRMAIGATPGDVLIQFLIEAVVLALVGGIIGITLGIGGAVGLAEVANWPVVVQPPVVLVAFLVAAGVGIFFGYYPALKASRLDPIDALRYE
ncbi:MAG TPA: ABC transporter permease, partial [Gemmataceae bacterium]|nr:ABC transporter permease [Gemmataceae bacterium]